MIFFNHDKICEQMTRLQADKADKGAYSELRWYGRQSVLGHSIADAQQRAAAHFVLAGT